MYLGQADTNEATRLSNSMTVERLSIRMPEDNTLIDLVRCDEVQG